MAIGSQVTNPTSLSASTTSFQVLAHKDFWFPELMYFGLCRIPVEKIDTFAEPSNCAQPYERSAMAYWPFRVKGHTDKFVQCKQGKARKKKCLSICLYTNLSWALIVKKTLGSSMLKAQSCAFWLEGKTNWWHLICTSIFKIACWSDIEYFCLNPTIHCKMGVMKMYPITRSLKGKTSTQNSCDSSQLKII